MNQVHVKMEVFTNQDIQTKGTVVCALGASRLLTAKEVLSMNSPKTHHLNFPQRYQMNEMQIGETTMKSKQACSQ